MNYNKAIAEIKKIKEVQILDGNILDITCQLNKHFTISLIFVFLTIIVTGIVITFEFSMKVIFLLLVFLIFDLYFITKYFMLKITLKGLVLMYNACLIEYNLPFTKK